MEANARLETRLLHALNKFIALVGAGDSGSGGGGACSARWKVVANFLRLHILSHLRQLQSASVAGGERDVLTQWWVTLLNFLASDSGADDDADSCEGGSPYGEPLAIEVVSVALECISRIVAAAAVVPQPDNTHLRDLDVYAYHLHLTVHFVTNKLIANTKKRKFLQKRMQQDTAAPAALNYISAYNSLLNLFMGKLMAYAFFYLDPSLRYDFLILRALEPRVACTAGRYPIAPWKDLQFSLSELETEPETETETKPFLPASPNPKIYQVMVSYLRNDNVFLAFYWHYWYIALTLLNKNAQQQLVVSDVPGGDVLLKHVRLFLEADLQAYARFVKAQEPDMFQWTKPQTSNVNSSSEALRNNFIFVNFKTIKLWECLRTLVGCTDSQFPALTHQLIQLHDLQQLESLGAVPAYDHMTANLAFNKIIQFIVFQFESTLPKYLSDIHWAKWVAGVIGMLKTLNVNCQTVGLTFLFNIWKFIPNETYLKQELAHTIISELWEPFTIDCDFDSVRILFMKLAVFQIMQDRSSPVMSLLASRITDVYNEAVHLANLGITVDLRNSAQDSLIFHGNKKLVLMRAVCTDEDSLIFGNDHTKNDRKKVLFPQVLSVAGVRPLVVLNRGSYAFDVLDQMVLRAAKAAAVKKKARLQSNKVSRSSSFSVDDGVEGRNIEDRGNSLSTAFSSLMSKFSQIQSQTKPTSASGKDVRSSGLRKPSSSSLYSSETRMDAEPSEIFSMHSNLSRVSSLSVDKSTSSLDLHKQPSNSPNTSEQSVSKSRQASAKDSGNKAAKQRHKLLAPPELKFSGNLNHVSLPVWTFCLMTAPPHSDNASALARIQSANAKWGVVTARNYDKPLPPTRGQGSSASTPETEIDLQSLQMLLNDTVVDDKNLVGGQPDLFEHHHAVPEPLVENISSMNSVSNVSDDATLTKGKPPSIEKETDLDDKCLVGSIPKANHSKKMLLQTRLNKLTRVIEVFNATVLEFQSFMDLQLQDDVTNIFMNFELNIPKSSQVDAKFSADAETEYL
ncbi:LAMI_0A02058g1_1 [Lachancea mirantina]|uniref:LAMI_0A02058g1_1 n=1 Tax=Lachancea mirantina TaxID=1230905 RepID=A0A1G4IMS6_9SACH|nr:LAMI_0A02058g1_1 [Lachancea mirantina]